MKSGQVWKDYKVVVSSEVNGKVIKRSKTINLKAGQEVDLAFDFGADLDQVAVR